MAIGRLHHVVIDTPEPAGLARFYSALLDLPIVYESEDWVVVAADDRTSGIAFQLAPDHEVPDWPDPARPQQCHLDVMVDDLAVSGAAVQALGASRLNPGVTSPLIFADPSGHPFCLITRPGWAPPVSEAAARPRRGSSPRP